MRMLHRTEPVPRTAPSLEKPSRAACVLVDGRRVPLRRAGDHDLWNAAVLLSRYAVVACGRHLKYWVMTPPPDAPAARLAFLAERELELGRTWRDFASTELRRMLREMGRRGVQFEPPAVCAEVVLAERFAGERRA